MFVVVDNGKQGQLVKSHVTQSYSNIDPGTMNSHLTAVCALYIAAMYLSFICAQTKIETQLTKCPPGYEPKIARNGSHSCKVCPREHFSAHRSQENCRPCRRCNDNETIISECTDVKNRKCIKNKKRKRIQLVLNRGSRNRKSKEGLKTESDSRWNQLANNAVKKTTKTDELHKTSPTEDTLDTYTTYEDVDSPESRPKTWNAFFDGPGLLISVVAVTSLAWVMIGLILYCVLRRMKTGKPWRWRCDIEQDKPDRSQTESCKALIEYPFTINTPETMIAKPLPISYEKETHKSRSVSDFSRSYISLFEDGMLGANDVDIFSEGQAFDLGYYTQSDQVLASNFFHKYNGYNGHCELECDVFGCNWQFDAVFDAMGGQMSKERSAILLEFPKDSFPSEGSYSVSGSIYTSPRSLREKLKISDNWEIASPLAEYTIDGIELLNTHAILKMPTTVNRATDNVKVYWFQSKAETTTPVLCEVPMKTDSEEDGELFYEFGTNGYINIHTKHFTGFIVCKDCNKKCSTNTLHAAIFGRYQQRDEGHYAKLVLYVMSNYYTIKDCLEGLKQHEETFGRSLKECKEIEFEKNFDETSKLLINIELEHEHWRHRLRQNGNPIHDQRKVGNVERILQCSCQAQFPKCFEWELETKAGYCNARHLDCYIDIKLHMGNEDICDDIWESSVDRVTMSYTDETRSEKIATPPTATHTTDVHSLINCMSKTLSTEDVINFARECRIGDVDIKDCQIINGFDSMREQRFQILNMVKNRLGTSTFLKTVVPTLRQMNLIDAAETMIGVMQETQSLTPSDCSSVTLTSEQMSLIQHDRLAPDGSTLERRLERCHIEENPITRLC
ncbi:hypothetical protein ScPMuIL_015909 [Solemya velum]